MMTNLKAAVLSAGILVLVGITIFAGSVSSQAAMIPATEPVLVSPEEPEVIETVSVRMVSEETEASEVNTMDGIMAVSTEGEYAGPACVMLPQEKKQQLMAQGKVDSFGRLTNVWVTPIQDTYYISSGFGMRMHPVLGYERMHEGIDMSCDEGTPIYAARSGEVMEARWNDSCGWYVWIDHGDGYRTVYMHMTHFTVSEGQSVEAGQVIGFVGSTGLSSGEHLHFGVWLNGGYINPLTVISE